MQSDKLTPGAGPGRLVVASYNVHGCRGMDGRINVQRVAAVIRSTGAGIVGLQEVDCRIKLPDGSDPLTRLAAATGMQAVPGPTLRAEQGYYGNGLLTGHRVVDLVHTDLSVPRREPRGMMDVFLQIEGTILRVVVTHFGLRSQERRRQVDTVLDILQARKAHAIRPFHVMVLLGDFNEWRPRAATLARLHDAFGHTPTVRTFPARWPILALDRLWVHPRTALLCVWAVNSPLARAASDHLPLVARLGIAGAPSEGPPGATKSDPRQVDA